MTIFVTGYKAVGKKVTAPSLDSGFPSLEAVIEAVGTNYLYKLPRMIVYGGDEDRVVFSDNFDFAIDDEDNNG